jgi:hypothetical protein
MRIACTLNWVMDAVKVNTTFNASNDKYKLEVCNISEKAAEALTKEFGIKVKQDEKKGRNFSCKSKYQFIFRDDVGNLVEPSSIGNGSKAVVNVTGSYEHKFMKQYGKGPVAASDVVVTELVSRATVGEAEEEEAL